MPKHLDKEVKTANQHVITCPCCGGNKLYKYPYNKTNVDMLFYCCDCTTEFWVSISPVIFNNKDVNQFNKAGFGGVTK